MQPTNEDIFTRHLEIFRTEQETASQYFFAYLGIRSLAAERGDVLRMINRNSLFWITSHHAMLMSTFIALGRIFDNDSKFNIGKLRRVTENNLDLFSLDALRGRKAHLPGVDADEYVRGKHEFTVERLNAIGDQIDAWQEIYATRYKAIRHQFAHKRLATLDQVNALLAKTDIEEMKRMFGFLHALHLAIYEAWLNGLDPVVHARPFVLPPEPMPSDYMAGEKAFREAQRVVLSMLPETTVS